MMPGHYLSSRTEPGAHFPSFCLAHPRSPAARTAGVYNRGMITDDRLSSSLHVASLAFRRSLQMGTTDESKVPAYTLPDVLGKAHDAKSWETTPGGNSRDVPASDVFGRAPGKPSKMTSEVVGQGPALNGKATRELVELSFGSGPKLHMLVYVPAGATKPSPVFLGLNFGRFTPLRTTPACRSPTNGCAIRTRRRW